MRESAIFPLHELRVVASPAVARISERELEIFRCLQWAMEEAGK